MSASGSRPLPAIRFPRPSPSSWVDSSSSSQSSSSGAADAIFTTLRIWSAASGATSCLTLASFPFDWSPSAPKRVLQSPSREKDCGSSVKVLGSSKSRLMRSLLDCHMTGGTLSPDSGAESTSLRPCAPLRFFCDGPLCATLFLFFGPGVLLLVPLVFAAPWTSFQPSELYSMSTQYSK